MLPTCLKRDEVNEVRMVRCGAPTELRLSVYVDNLYWNHKTTIERVTHPDFETV
jgi:hypothetical protein